MGESENWHGERIKIMEGDMNKNKGINKKVVIICIVCALAGGALLGGLGVMIYKDLNKSGQQTETSSDSSAGENLEDGAVFDFEEAGYMKLGTYKGLSAEVEPESDDVYSEMIAVAEETKVENDDVVKDGDVVNIDFTGKLDGKELEEASGEDTYVWIGKGEFIDDFEKGIVGIKNGKKKTIDCTFPSDYDDEEMAGKTVQFTIKVNGKFSDAVADKASDGKYKTVQEYYDYEKAKQLDENKENKGELVWDTLKEDATIDTAPETMLNRAQEDTKLMYTSFAELSGMTLEELMENFGMDEDGIEEIAQDTVKDYMISKTIAAKEGITMDDTYYKNALMTALGYEEGDDGTSLEAMEKEYKESQGSRPKDDMLIERVKDFVGENAKES